MRQYKLKETKEIDKIICNKCGKEIAVNHGCPTEDVLSVDKRWGYFSKKDNQVDLTCVKNVMMSLLQHLLFR